MLNQVTCVSTTRHLHPWMRIERLSGWRDDNGNGWSCSQPACIAYIEKGCRFYVQKGEDRVYLEVAVGFGGEKYLRSDADATAQQSLLSLPSCPI